MDEDDVHAVLVKILRIVEGLAEELERYRELLPEPGSVKARLARRKLATMPFGTGGNER